jgi:hypothetical protein
LAKVFIVDQHYKADYKVYFVDQPYKEMNAQIIAGGELVNEDLEANVKIFIVDREYKETSRSCESAFQNRAEPISCLANDGRACRTTNGGKTTLSTP